MFSLIFFGGGIFKSSYDGYFAVIFILYFFAENISSVLRDGFQQRYNNLFNKKTFDLELIYSFKKQAGSIIKNPNIQRDAAYKITKI